jgi:hypothetical protein
VPKIQLDDGHLTQLVGPSAGNQQLGELRFGRGEALGPGTLLRRIRREELPIECGRAGIVRGDGRLAHGFEPAVCLAPRLDERLGLGGA